MDQVKFFKGSLSLILLGQFLNSLSKICCNFAFNFRILLLNSVTTSVTLHNTIWLEIHTIVFNLLHFLLMAKNLGHIFGKNQKGLLGRNNFE